MVIEQKHLEISKEKVWEAFLEDIKRQNKVSRISQTEYLERFKEKFITTKILSLVEHLSNRIQKVYDNTGSDDTELYYIVIANGEIGHVREQSIRPKSIRETLHNIKENKKFYDKSS